MYESNLIAIIIGQLIGIVIGGLIGSLIGAILLRAAAHWVAHQEVPFGRAYLTVLICFFINSFLGFFIGIFTGLTGSATLVDVASLIMLPVGFLIQSWIISLRLDISFGRGCLVSLTMTGLILAIALVIGLIIFVIMLAAGMW